MMKLFVVLFCFITLATANVAEDNIRCFGGIQISSLNGTSVFDNSTATLCPVEATQCLVYRLQITDANNYTANVISGACSNPLYTPTCDDVRNTIPADQTLELCNVISCDPGNCNVTATNSPFRCHQGTRATIDGLGVVLDNSTIADCPIGADSCLVVGSTTRLADGSIVNAVTGLCGFPTFNTEEVVCAVFGEFTAPGEELLNCSLLDCASNPGDARCAETYETCPVGYEGFPDVQVLPGCTARGALEGVFTCLGPLMAGYPYNDQTMCLANVDSLVSCLIGQFGECTSGNCLSLIAQFVPNLDQVLQGFGDFPPGATLNDILNLIPNITDEVRNLVTDLTCPTPGLVPPAITQLLGQFGPVMAQIPFCDDEFVGDLVGYAGSFISKFYMATEHSDVCLAFGALKSQAFSNLNLRCGLEHVGGILTNLLPQNPSVVPEILTSLNIAMDFIKKVEIPGCENVLVCANGTVGSDRVNGRVYEGNLNFVNCGEGSQCVLINGSNIVNGTEGFFQTGFCAPSNVTVTCDDVAVDPLIDQLGSCEISHCSSTAFCPSPVFIGPSNLVDCPTPEGDIQILPSCTLKDTLNGLTECERQLLEGYPYSDQQICRNNLESAVLCVAQGASSCLNGNCRTVLDAIPGFRSAIQGFGPMIAQIQSLDDIFNYLQLDADTREIVLSFACPVGGQVPPLFEQLVSNIPQLNIGEPVCDNRIVDDLIQLGVSTARKFFMATEKSSICGAFTSSQYYIIEWMSRRCNEEVISDIITSSLPAEFHGFIPLISQAINILKEFGDNYVFPGCEGYLICPQGTRSIVQGTNLNVFDNSTYALCAPGYDQCAFLRTETSFDGGIAQSETGICASSAGQFTCDDAAAFSGTTFLACDINFCDDRFCPTFSLAPMRMQVCDIDEGDIQVLPSCTFKQTLNKTFDCLGGLVAGYPYRNGMVCQNNLDQAIQCMAGTVLQCLDGSCGTILDAIPEVRQFLPILKEQLGQINSIDDILYAIPDLEGRDDIRDLIYQFACPTSGVIPPLLQQFLDGLDLDSIQLPEVEFCGDNFLRNLIGYGLDFVRSFYTATTKREFCVAYGTLKVQIAGALRGCDVERLEQFLYTVIPQEAHSYIPLILKASGILENFFEQLEIPGCQGVSIMSPCDRFYEDQSSCGMQKGWICDYVSWRVDFFTRWMVEFRNYQQTMMLPGFDIPQVACIQGYPTNLCKNAAQMCLTEPLSGCSLCWCKDHEYTNVREVYARWRYDYSTWRNFFTKYQQFIGGNNMGNTCY